MAIHSDPDLIETSCTALAELLLSYLERALDLAARPDRDTRLEELGHLLDGAREAQRLWLRVASDD